MPEGELDHDRIIRLEDRLRCLEETGVARDRLISAFIALGGLAIAAGGILLAVLR